MKTLVKLYDSESIMNVYSPQIMHPDHVIYVLRKAQADKQARKRIQAYLRAYCGVTGSIHFMQPQTETVGGYLALFQEIYQGFPDCAMDLSGDDELILFAAGQFTCINPVPVFSYHHEKRGFSNICGFPSAETIDCTLQFTVQQYFRAVGASFSQHGHFNPHALSDLSDEFILQMWQLFMKFQPRWKRISSYLQRFNPPQERDIHFCAPLTQKLPDGERVVCDLDVIHSLAQVGVLKNISVNGRMLSFVYTDHRYKRLMNDVGVWLELFTYRCALSSGCFDDVQMSAVIDWNGIEDEQDNVMNEIDVIAVKGITPIFISCKSGIVSNAALNEIHTLTRLFGGRYARAVMVTATQLSEEAPTVYKRALELGICVIERADLKCGKMMDILKHLADA